MQKLKRIINKEVIQHHRKRQIFKNRRLDLYIQAAVDLINRDFAITMLLQLATLDYRLPSFTGQVTNYVGQNTNCKNDIRK